jgi:hypothetical protein
MSAFIVGTDPGAETGCAALDREGRLLWIGLGIPPVTQWGLYFKGAPEHVVIENPQYYSARKSKGNPNDLAKVTRMVGRYEERFESRGSHVSVFLPNEWKGTIDKEIHQARFLAERKQTHPGCLKLASDLLAKVPDGKKHNCVDGWAISVWFFNRILARP